MTHELTERLWDILGCPLCGARLLRTEQGARCRGCQEIYPLTERGQLDLRLRQERPYTVTVTVGADAMPHGDPPFGILAENSRPEVDLRRLGTPRHLNRSLLSHLPKARGEESLALDLGCGKGLHRAICEAAGFQYVGIDIRAPEAQLLGDAHALPFQDDTFEFLLSLAVLEHIRFPLIMAREAFRVLAPGGWMLGTVAFLEPFHSGSYYHHTHWGVYNTLCQAGFEIQRIGPGPKRSVLEAQAPVLFPRMPSPMAQALVLPLQVLHRLWWRLGRGLTGAAGASETQRAFSTCGSFAFMALKGKQSAQEEAKASSGSSAQHP